MFVRPCRSATIRTRLDEEAIREQLCAFVDQGSPDGMTRFMAHGYFLGGSVGPREFHLDYKFNSVKNPQKYAVRGRIQDTKDWRVLRLKLTAHAPWLAWYELAALVLFAAFYVHDGRVPPTGAILLVAFVMAIYAAANLLYIPDAVTARVSSMLAFELRGSVLQGGRWVVPQAD